MRALPFAVVLAAFAGCTSCMLVDISQGDAFSYRYSPWDNRDAEEAGARVKYWAYVGPKHYPTNEVLRMKLELYRGTNCIKQAFYDFPGTGEEAK